MTIDLCIVSYDTPQHLLRLLTSLHYDQDPHTRSSHIYIANNSKDTESLALLKHLGEEIEGKNVDDVAVKLIVQNDNIGYSAACNELASHGRSKYIGLLNGDVWLTDADVQALEGIMDSDPSIAILGPKQRNETGHIVHAGIIGTNEAPKHRSWKRHDPHDLLHKDRIDCVTVSGSAYFIRREVWETLSSCETYLNEEVVKRNDGFTGAFLPTPHYY